MRILAIISALLVASYAFADEDEEYIPSIYGMQSLSILCDTDAKLALVRAYEDHPSFDFLRIPHAREEPVEVLVTADKVDEFKNELEANDVRYEVLSQDMSEVIRAEMETQRKARRRRRAVSQSIDLTAFPRYEEIKNYIEYLGKTKSHILKAISIGKSYEGRELVGLKFSSGFRNKPALLIDAGIHSREWIAPTTALYVIKQLAENASNRYIFDNIDIYILPLLNPDGYEYTHLSDETRLWRKTRSDIPYSICKGVDANRNFAIKWMSVGSSSYPCSHTYAGSRSFSEPETRALRDFILARRDRIRTYLSFHSFGNYLLYPWGYARHLPANEPVLRCVAEKAEAELSRVRGTRYKIGSSANVLYPAAGGSDDWAMGIAGIDLAYTVELPGRKYNFVAPPEEIIPVGVETFQAVKVFAKYVEGKICRRQLINC